MMLNDKQLKILNFILFQIGWLACVLFAANQLPYLSVAAVAVIMCVHFYFVTNKRNEVIFIIIATTIGTLIDSFNLLISVLSHLDADKSPIAPIWLISLWVLFTSTIRHSLSWLSNKPYLAAALGAVFAPLAYFAGNNLGALNLNGNIAFSLSVIGAVWAIVTPSLFWINNGIEKFNSSKKATSFNIKFG